MDSHPKRGNGRNLPTKGSVEEGPASMAQAAKDENNLSPPQDLPLYLFGIGNKTATTSAPALG